MIRSTDKIAVIGRSGCGKSYLGRRIQEMFPRRVIIDTLDEYSEEDGQVVHSFEEFTEAILQIEQQNISSYTLIFQFDSESHLSIAEFDHVCRILFYLGNVLLVIEEVQDYASVHNLPHWLRQCLLKGRHRNLGLIFTSQRPGEIHKTILSQCSHVFCGTITDGNDLRYLSNIFKEKTQQLVTLPDRNFLYFSRDGVNLITNDF